MISVPLALSVLCLLLPACQAVWPRPQTTSGSSRTFVLSSDFCVSADSSTTFPDDLYRALNRTQSGVKAIRHRRLTPDHGEEDRSLLKSAATLTKLVLKSDQHSLGSLQNDLAKPYGQRNETYTLTFPNLSSNGSTAVLSSGSALGLLRGLQTFESMPFWLPTQSSSNLVAKQGMYATQETGTLYLRDVAEQYDDFPAFPWRGLLLDTSRNFYPMSVLKQTIDAMATVKMNTFHWHITDSQSWPLEMSGFEDLAKNGAYSSSQVYTTKAIKQLESYAADRGVSVMLELDMPGHTGSIGFTHPDLMACPNEPNWMTYANEPPSGQLKLTADGQSLAVSIVSKAAELTKSPVYASGGDEINMKCYANDTDTQSFLQQKGLNFTQGLSEFIQAIHEPVHQLNKTPAVWEELVLDYNVTTLTNDTIVMVWISSDNVKSVVERGYRVVHAASDYLYLDCGHGGWLGNFTGNSWCDPFKTWQKTYSFDPYANLTSSQHQYVLGGESLLWSEQADSANVHQLIWPRAAASAEVFWSGAGGNAAEALSRLHDWRFRAVGRGLPATPLQPQWCARRPGACDFY